MHHAAHEAERQNDGHGEEPGEELAPVALEGRGDVVDWTAVHGTVLVDYAGLLGHDRLGVVGGHAEQGDDPHPEDGARAAHDDGTAGAHDVARAHLGRDSGGQRLERRLPPRRLKLPNTRRQPSPKQRNWIALVRTVNQMPMPSSRMIRM